VQESTAASISPRSAGLLQTSPSTASRKVETVEYPELGMEAIWRIEVVRFPAFIVIDEQGQRLLQGIESRVSYVSQAPHRARGPLVWRDMGFSRRSTTPTTRTLCAENRPLIVARRIAASERARAALGPPQRVAYGPSEYEKLDIFRITGVNAPVNVFVHGGAWRRNKAADYALQAEPLMRAGAHCVINRLHQCRASRRRSDADVRAGAPRAGLDMAQRGKVRRRPERFYISAHSSGSHLCRLRAHRRLARGRPAEKFLQGRASSERQCTISNRCGCRSGPLT